MRRDQGDGRGVKGMGMDWGLSYPRSTTGSGGTL